jgi:hypothetical protein
MANCTSALASLTLTDLERCYRIQTYLDHVDDAVMALNGSRGLAIRELLRLAYNDSIDIMRKGARQALRKAAAGMYRESTLPVEFWERLCSLAAPQATMTAPNHEPEKGEV